MILNSLISWGWRGNRGRMKLTNVGEGILFPRAQRAIHRSRNHAEESSSRQNPYFIYGKRETLSISGKLIEVLGLRFIHTVSLPNVEFYRHSFLRKLIPGTLDERWILRRTMAGHSKWQNIKHIKQSKDHERSMLFSRLAKLIRLAVQSGKSVNPKLNHHLAQVISQAKQANMPVSKIETILKQCENSKAFLIPFTIEAKGPGGCFLIIEILTDNVNRTKASLKHDLNKYGITMVDGIKHAFNHKGVLCIDPATNNIDLEAAFNVAIEVGSEDVLETTDVDGKTIFQFLCDPKTVHAVKTALESKSCTIKTFGIQYLPHIYAKLNDEQVTVMSKVVQILENHPDVTDVFDNIEYN